MIWWLKYILRLKKLEGDRFYKFITSRIKLEN